MRQGQRGYTLPELLTVVAIMGLVVLVSIPAIFQLTPQYRMRSTTSEVAAVVRMARQNALSTRRAWRVTFDTSNRRYILAMQRTPASALTSPAEWVAIGSNNRPSKTTNNAWRSLRYLNVLTAPGFVDVDSANGPDIIFRYDGALDPSCYSSTTPNVRLHVDNRLVRYNTYYLRIGTAGYVTTDQTKE
jgi:prepilin-type N-terminal cleavage/methylation domain-containing protein